MPPLSVLRKLIMERRGVCDQCSMISSASEFAIQSIKWCKKDEVLIGMIYQFHELWGEWILWQKQTLRAMYAASNWDKFGTLQWLHNGRDDVPNNRRLNCLLNRFFRRRWKKIKAQRHWPLWGDSPHKGPVTRKMYPFDDVIMWCLHILITCVYQYCSIIANQSHKQN